VGYIRNQELQYYAQAREGNAHVADGHLVITAPQDDYQGHRYTSASLHTKGKVSWIYGRIEVSARLPTGVGMWPAIWMLGTNIDQVGWPRCGEIDIMENVGFDPHRIHVNVHTEAYNLILNAAVGGMWGGQYGVDDTIFPQDYVIDYVRVYELIQ